jgi:subfamily B ATP-binding cassette protein MsbA
VRTWARLLRYLGPYRAQVAVALAAMVVLALTTGLYPLLLDLLTTLLFKGREAAASQLAPRLEGLASALSWLGLSADGAALGHLLEHYAYVLFGAVVALKAVSQAVRFYAMGRVAQQVIRDLRHDLFSAIVRQSPQFFGGESTGFLVSRVMNDVAQVERAATYAVPVLFGDVLRVLVLGGVCLWQYTELSVVTLVVLPLAALPIVRFGKALRRYAKQGQHSVGALTHRITETLGGIRVVHTYGGEGHEVARFGAESDRYVAVMLKSVLARAVQTPIMELIGTAALLLTVVWAEWRIEAGAVRPGEVVAFLLALVLLYEPLKAIGRLNGIVLPGLTAAERVFELVDRVPDIVDAPNARAAGPLADALVLDGVRFRYPGGERDALASLDLVLRRGRVVGLAGASGSGKSTVAALIPRLWDVTGGRITLDGVDLRELTLASLRHQIAVVSQETYLFDDSVRANIAYGRPGATAAEVEAAARAAYAHDFIQALPQGYDTVTGERGVRLSGGQRQRIAIARAFLRDAPILVLDEATSALDNESEREVQRALDALLRDRAALVIAHRLSTLRNVDELVVLDQGVVVERGAPSALARAGGVYARLLAAAEGEL